MVVEKRSCCTARCSRNYLATLIGECCCCLLEVVLLVRNIYIHEWRHQNPLTGIETITGLSETKMRTYRPAKAARILLLLDLGLGEPRKKW